MKQILIKQPIELPCSRVVNGFRLVAEFVSPADGDFRVFWRICPNNYHGYFYFKSLEHATKFALIYNNCHSDKFWYGIWHPIYSLDNVLKKL